MKFVGEQDRTSAVRRQPDFLIRMCVTELCMTDDCSRLDRSDERGKLLHCCVSCV